MNMKSNRLVRRQKGALLVDLALAVGLIGLGIVLVVGLYRVARSEVLAFSAGQELLEMQERIRDYYVARPNYNTPALSDAGVLAANLVPRRMISGSPAATRTRWRTAVAVSTLSDEQFRIATSVPRLECPALVSEVAPNFAQIALNGGLGWNVVATNGQMDVAAVGQRCQEGSLIAVRMDSR